VRVNPFLPYNEDLWVAHLSDTHTLLLNKFNLVEHHTLVVTRVFEPQEARLSAADLLAVQLTMQVELPFYI
jgi:sulfate adenylyltransferase (ADP) / ATP adenylyltransferase